MSFFKKFALSASLFSASVANAGTSYEAINQTEHYSLNGTKLAHDWLFEYRSTQENMDVFAEEVASLFIEETLERGAEVCGIIARDPKTNTLGIIVGTSNVRPGCILANSKIPHGMVTTGETIHTHPSSASPSLTRAEKRFVMAMQGQDTGSLQLTKVVSLNPTGFSQIDFDGGPGYLVLQDETILHQSGNKNSVRTIRRP